MAIFKRLKRKSRAEEAEFRSKLSQAGLEKNDMFALTFSAFLVFVPVCLAVLLAIAGVALLLFT